MDSRAFIAIDLKSFYASVECVERGLDPLATNLVVADPDRTEKTICLAVSPSLKAYGIPGRARLFEVIERVRQVNADRRRFAPGGVLVGKSTDAPRLSVSPELALDFLVAPPQMAHYMEVSTQIYRIYLKYVAPEDVHVYSIDEVFIDATEYLHTYRMTARELAMTMILDVLHTTGITATAGIGTNLYLAKIAMDIGAKHISPDANGVRIAELDEMRYRRTLWDHRPLTDFWRVGPGYAKRLEGVGLYTMGDIARCSVGSAADYHNEALLYRLFGINAELLIDHAWGYEPCRISDIKAYRPEANSIGSGQVLQHPYNFEKARLIIREMTDQLVLELVEKHLMTDQILLTVGYDIENMNVQDRAEGDKATDTDRYGRIVPKQAHATATLASYSSSTKEIMEAMTALYDRIVDRNLSVRRMYIAFNRVRSEQDVPQDSDSEQLDLFTDYAARDAAAKAEKTAHERERRRQEAMIEIRKRFGKNAILKGMNLEEGATTRERNRQIGGHKA